MSTQIEQAARLALGALESATAILEHADCSTGYCCCGSAVEGHTLGDGHSPVDEGAYAQSNAMERFRNGITALQAALEKPAQCDRCGMMEMEIKALKEKLAEAREQPAQDEPVGYFMLYGSKIWRQVPRADSHMQDVAPLYTRPQAREPLTRDRTMELANETAGQHWMDEAHIQRFRAAVERTHDIKDYSCSTLNTTKNT